LLGAFKTFTIQNCDFFINRENLATNNNTISIVDVILLTTVLCMKDCNLD